MVSAVKLSHLSTRNDFSQRREKKGFHVLPGESCELVCPPFIFPSKVTGVQYHIYYSVDDICNITCSQVLLITASATSFHHVHHYSPDHAWYHTYYYYCVFPACVNQLISCAL